MAFVQMTDEEKALLDFAYTDGKRILEGMLFDYQEKALGELRACREYLNSRYPHENFRIIAFQPSSRKGCVEMQFVLPERDETEYILKYEDGLYTDNFYDVPFEREYDELIEHMLTEAEIPARVYTYFPFLISDVISSGKDLLERRPRLGRHTALFVDANSLDEQEAEAAITKIKKIFKDNGIYSSGILFLVPDLDKMSTESVQELDRYCRDLENHISITGIPFRCFDVER